MGITIYPKFLRFEPVGSLVFRHVGGKEYWIDNGCWGVTIATRDDGVRYVKESYADTTIGKVLVPATMEEYIESVGEYGVSFNHNNHDSDYRELVGFVSKLSEGEIALIVKSYKSGMLSIGDEADDEDDVPF